ncbi:hypothetical protein M427DRAFT_374165 [Gonapodya prolifera JEL478]|uniref:Uncharacterized protein n=1 Tax=Gonapodya prolifera (strain JEL478) TaxID=1344416 RepID=A0A139AUI4_GONPJ|nr:hypothetical protein M427DRAFT_374165 [Gonapodya prolifera JEL478]|eukprot:KXS20378.1 hypothetical protein M427DRAFT_374165 [Gonapodya prolifera JEL478]
MTAAAPRTSPAATTALILDAQSRDAGSYPLPTRVSHTCFTTPASTLLAESRSNRTNRLSFHGCTAGLPSSAHAASTSWAVPLAAAVRIARAAAMSGVKPTPLSAFRTAIAVSRAPRSAAVWTARDHVWCVAWLVASSAAMWSVRRDSVPAWSERASGTERKADQNVGLVGGVGRRARMDVGVGWPGCGGSDERAVRRRPLDVKVETQPIAGLSPLFARSTLSSIAPNYSSYGLPHTTIYAPLHLVSNILTVHHPNLNSASTPMSLSLASNLSHSPILLLHNNPKRTSPGDFKKPQDKLGLCAYEQTFGQEPEEICRGRGELRKGGMEGNVNIKEWGWWSERF